MRSIFFSITFVLSILLCTVQKAKAQPAINLGEVLHEKLKFTTLNNSDAYVKIPADTFVILYKYRGNNWLMDNKDSVQMLEAIIADLQKKNPVFRKLMLVCYSYNKDKYLNAFNGPAFKPSDTYRIRNYYLNDKNPPRVLRSGKVVLLNKRGKVLAFSAYVGEFKYTHKDEPKRFRAKLMTEKDGQQVPVANAIVVLPSQKAQDTLALTRTDKYGDFEVSIPESMEEGTLQISSVDKTIETIIMATQEGVEKSRITKKAEAFEYKFIEADVYSLSESDLQEDLALAFSTFMESTDKEYKRSEFINYDLGSYRIENSSKLVLDGIAQIMTDNSGISLEVISHTDSQGDDKSNLELSEKRSLSVTSYLILIGVHKDRLTYTGKGETEIRNRCTNGVDCSPTEHLYNRRTEFRFSKK